MTFSHDSLAAAADATFLGGMMLAVWLEDRNWQGIGALIAVAGFVARAALVW